MHVRVEVSHNGRPHRLLVDPGIDLAGIAADTPVTDWTMPAEGGDSPFVRLFATGR